jgi:hypothetical protein
VAAGRAAGAAGRAAGRGAGAGADGLEDEELPAIPVETHSKAQTGSAGKIRTDFR